MMFVCVGASRPFDRLIKKVDDIAQCNKYKFLAQIGKGKYEPKYFQFFRYMPHGKMIEIIKRSEMVITHGGFGSILDCLKMKKRIIAVPKTFELDETDNDQTETVKYLEKKELLKGVYDLEQLEQTMEFSLNDDPSRAKVAYNCKITETIRQFLEKDSRRCLK